MRTKISSAVKVSLLALSLSFGLSFVYAWTAPTQSPPAGNVSAPINTSATTQTKTGGLGVLGHMGIGANPDINSQLNVDGASNSSSRILLSNTNTGTNAAAKYQIDVSGGSLNIGKMGSNFGTGGAGILAGEAFISNSSGNFKYMVLGSIKAVIDANGKVGIGGASLPSQTLTVAGDVGATGDICTSVTGSAVCLSTVTTGGVTSASEGGSCTTAGIFGYNSALGNPLYCSNSLVWTAFNPGCTTLYCGTVVASLTTADSTFVIPSGVNYIAFTARGGDGYNSSGSYAGGAGSSVYVTNAGNKKLLMVSGGGGGSGYSSGNGGSTMTPGAGGLNGAGGGAGWGGTAGVNYTGGGGNGGDPSSCPGIVSNGGIAGINGDSNADATGGSGTYPFTGGSKLWRGVSGGGGGYGGGGAGIRDTGCSGGDDHDGGGGGGGGYRDSSLSTTAVSGLASLISGAGYTYTPGVNITVFPGDTLTIRKGAGTGAYVYAAYGHR